MKMMIRELIHDPMFLGIKSKPATKEDSLIASDLLDTLNAHRETCVGMAANMIGKTVKIIAFIDGVRPTVMYNPEITFKAAPYETEEGCLSLLGAPRKTTRYKTIKVKYQDDKFQWKTKSFSGFTAQIIQHEIDHCKRICVLNQKITLIKLNIGYNPTDTLYFHRVSVIIFQKFGSSLEPVGKNLQYSRKNLINL